MAAWRLLWVVVWMMAVVTPIRAAEEQPVEVLPDSSNYVTASLLTISPTAQIYSVFGHVAMRMECPSHALDYVFSFETQTDVNGFLAFFAGKGRAAFVAVPTEAFLDDMRSLGRGVTQYTLNLTHHEKQQLWRLLDEDMVAGAQRKFNLLLNNCVSTAIYKMQMALIGEAWEWGEWTGVMTLNNGDLVRHNARRSPWAEFLFTTFLGTGYADHYDQELRLCPEVLPEVLSHARLVSLTDSASRPVLTDTPRQLLPATTSVQAPFVSPTVLLVSLLTLVLLLTAAEWLIGWHRLARWMDMLLLIAQTLAGSVLLYITVVSEIFGLLWNWYLIPLNPLPALIWAVGHKKAHFGRVYGFYCLVLLAFIALTPVMPQLDWTHQIAVAVLAVRCGSRYMQYNNHNHQKQ